MNDTKKDRAEQIALFRYGLIADLVHMQPGERGIYARLAEKAERSYCIPGTLRTKVAVETLRHWLKHYRKGGFDALLPRPRRDVGSPRALPQEVADALCAIKEDNADLSVQLVMREAASRKAIPEGLVLAPSTVHRLLSRRGLMRRLVPGDSQDRRRFAFEKPNELWMSDVMHGPAVFVGRQKRKTYLVAFIDDATRVIPFAVFALAENTQAFLPVFKQAVVRRGVPKRLYVDNGSAFRSQHLALVCAKLGVTLIHTRAYDAAAKGKQERWFRTVRMQLLTRLADADLQSIDILNRKLWAYVEGEYHRTPHKGLDGRTPMDLWAERAADIALVRPELDLEDLFLFEQRRQVKKDRTVSLHGIDYEVDATLVSQAVTLRFDPARPGAPVQIFCEGRRYPDAKVVDTGANCFVKRERHPSEPGRSTLRLAELTKKENL